MQFPADPIDAPDKLITVPFAAAVTVPPQLLPTLGVLATVNPAGSVSLKAMLLSELEAFGFVMTKVRLESPPLSGMLVGEKEILIVGGAMTVTEALEVLPVPPSVEVTLTLLFFAPSVVPVTFTLKTHEPLAASVPPERLMEEEPAVARIPPLPHVPESPLGVATSKPAGSESVKATPDKGEAVFGLVIVKVSEVVPLSEMLEAPKEVASEGGKLVPVPVRPRVCGLFPAPSVTARVALRAPAAPGVNVTVIVQVLLLVTGELVLHVPPEEKSPPSVPVNAILEMLSVLPESLVRETVIAGLLGTPTAWLPKARLVGDRLTGKRCKKMDTLLAFPLATARSRAPSPLKSAVATPNAPLAVV